MLNYTIIILLCNCAARSEFGHRAGRSGVLTEERGAKYKPRGRGLGRRNMEINHLQIIISKVESFHARRREVLFKKTTYFLDTRNSGFFVHFPQDKRCTFAVLYCFFWGCFVQWNCQHFWEKIPYSKSYNSWSCNGWFLCNNCGNICCHDSVLVWKGR